MSIMQLNLQRQVLTTDYFGHAVWQAETEQRSVASERTAILVCDMWDNHWSRGAAERVDELAPRVNGLLRVARAAGVHIIHAPSDTMEFYAGTAPRLRIASLPPVDPPPLAEHDDPPLPIDDSDGGSDTGETETYPAWNRQHQAIEIAQDDDVVSDDGPEIYGYLHHNRLEQLFILGVHTNMCVLNRSFAIKNMVRWGVEVALVRDLTDAMYNPARAPYVSHQEGTNLVVGYIEKFWCPTVSSDELMVT